MTPAEKARIRYARWLAKPGSREKVRAAAKRSRARHRKTIAAKHRAWWRANRAWSRARYRRVGGAAQRAWQRRNPQKVAAIWRRWRKRNATAVRAWRRASYRRHKDTHLAAYARRRARLAGSPSIERIDRRALYERDRGVCHVCGRRVSIRRFHLDHVVPLARGGAHTAANLAVAHPRCNLRKGARLDYPKRRLAA